MAIGRGQPRDVVAEGRTAMVVQVLQHLHAPKTGSVARHLRRQQRRIHNGCLLS
jgi:hypothetical protein